MPRTKRAPRKLGKGRRPARLVMGRRVGYMGRYLRRAKNWHQGKNYASIKEAYTFPIVAGNMNYFQDALADLNFDRAQAVAVAYQQYRIKYIKLTFKPNNDTYPTGAGSVIPNLYFMIDKTRTIPPGASFDTLKSLGCKPVRIDDYNIHRAWKPSVLGGAVDSPAGAVSGIQLRVSPWLATNGNAGAGGAWVPDETLHYGAVFAIEKVNAGDAQAYSIDVEVMFEFRRPSWKASSGEQVMTTITSGKVTTETVTVINPPAGAKTNE